MSDNLARAKVGGEISSSQFDQIAELAEKVSGLGAGFKNARLTSSLRMKEAHRPESKDELWRYTRPELFPWEKLLKPLCASIELKPFANTSSAIPTGVSVKFDAAALKENPGCIAALLDSNHGEISSDWVANAQLSALTSICTITVDKRKVVNEPLLLSRTIKGTNDGAESSLVVVNVGEGAAITIVDDLSQATAALMLSRVEINVGDGANVKFVSVQRLEDSAAYLGRHHMHLGRDSSLQSICIAVGARVGRLDLDLNLNGAGASADLLGVSIASGKRHLDFHPTQRHLAPHCRSELYSKGIVTDAARSVYYGYIRVAEGAQKTDAYQTNRNLVLAASARADSIPNLEIKANDVRCSHGASVGHVSAEDMFYLMSRGLSRATAERILVEGFLEDVLSRIKDSWLHDWLHEIVIGRLNHGA